MKSLKGISLNDIYWRVPWGVILRMLTDLPSQKYIDKDKDDDENEKETKELTPQTSDDFKKHIEQLNAKKRKK